MATINHQAYPHSTTHTRRLCRHSLDSTSTTTSNSLSLKPPPNTTISLASHITFSISTTSPMPATTPETTTAPTPSLESLQRHLEAENFRQADEVTRRLLIVLAGEAAVKRGYVFFSEVQFIPKEDLIAIDELWSKFSNGRFGYRVQKKIWVKADREFTSFFIKVGWMKKLDTEIEQYNYRAFPNEFIWELNPSPSSDSNEGEVEEEDKGSVNVNVPPPEGHLPLTNALRGTQLLKCIFTHPAFAEDEDDEEIEEEKSKMMSGEDDNKKKSKFASLRDKLFKPNYTF